MKKLILLNLAILMAGVSFAQSSETLPQKTSIVSNGSQTVFSVNSTNVSNLFPALDVINQSTMIGSHAIKGKLGSSGIGIGQATAILGESNHGAGLTGISNQTYGVFGVSNSKDGVFGSSSSEGYGGVYGRNDNNLGFGLYGFSAAAGIGVKGESNEGKAGVFSIYNGENSSIALEGSTAGSGIAISGTNHKTTGNNTGVFGTVYSTSAGSSYANGTSGVLGVINNIGTGDFSSGVRGVNDATNARGAGVAGVHNNGGIGVFGQSNIGKAIYGFSGSTSAGSTAVRGEIYSPNGNIFHAVYAGTGVGTGLLLENSVIKVTGTNKAAFTHVATAANKYSANGTTIDHPFYNNDPNAILLVTHKINSTNTAYLNSPIGVYYSNTMLKWEIFTENSTVIPDNTMFNVLIIKSN